MSTPPNQIPRRDLVDHYSIAESFIRERSACARGFRQGSIYSYSGFPHWWKHRSPEEGRKRRYNLFDHEDYTELVTKARTLYYTTNFFHPDVFTRSVQDRKEIHELGNVNDLTAIQPFFDIDLYDHIKPRLKEKAVRKALEYAVRFTAGKWLELSPHGTFAYNSDGGAYVQLAPQMIGGPRHSRLPMQSAQTQAVLDAFDLWIQDVRDELFNEKPELKQYIKGIDALNHSVRLMKSPWSIHKTQPVCCAPLDATQPEIIMAELKIPVKPSTLQKWEGWFDTDMKIPDTDVKAILEALRPYIEKTVTRTKQITDTSKEIEISPEAIPIDHFPPCIKWIIQEADLKTRSGGCRCLGFLACFLKQAGWEEKAAYQLWEPVAETFGIKSTSTNKSHYFTDWYTNKKLAVPCCQKIRAVGKNYPSMYMADIGVCRPNELCSVVATPIEYSKRYATKMKPMIYNTRRKRRR